MPSLRYFVTYSGTKLPLQLVNPIQEEELGNRNTYICAEYDDQDRLIRLDKLVYGEVELTHCYRYYQDGRLKAVEVAIGDDRQVMVFPPDASVV